jgi:flagellum-specific ATP synthase
MFEQISSILDRTDAIGRMGRIENIIGMAMEASGYHASIGDICLIHNEELQHEIPAEVVGFHGDQIKLMTYESTSGITSGSFVRNTRHRLRIPVGDFLKGRIINAMGAPIDGGAPFPEKCEKYTVNSGYTNPLERPPIREQLTLGIKAIDGLNTIGKGQRIGIFAGSGVGKSTLMGMIAKNVTADINVIALVGERGREVLEFAEKDLGPEGMKRSVLIVATSDQPAMMRLKCPLVATTVAEYFRDQGLDVLLMMDSLTRYAMAQREIGLATGEPPIARGYTPSIYAEFPRLLERAGQFNKGSITGIYTVLVEGDDTNEPIADTVRGILDGHIVLSRALAAENHYPAINIGASVSRLMVELVSEEHRRYASRMRNMLGLYQKNADLISIGAYKHGTNAALDEAVEKYPRINEFLMQGTRESFSYDETVSRMKEIVGES